MTDTFRAMCAELVAAVDLLCGSGDSPGQPGSRLILTVHVEALDELANRARALLDQPAAVGVLPLKERPDFIAGYGEGLADGRRIIEREEAERRPTPQPPADGEVAELVAWLQDRADSTSIAANANRARRIADLLQHQHPQPAAEGPTLKEVSEFIDKEAPKSWNFGAQHHDVMRIVLAAITRWGRPTPQPPADGEVAELVEWLTTLRDHDLQHVAPYSHPSIAHWHDFLTRAAELLERPTPQPVAVSERLPGPEDCDEQGRCWVGGGQLVSGSPTWILGYSAWASRFPDVHYCWLPANALPIPEATNDG